MKKLNHKRHKRAQKNANSAENPVGIFRRIKLMCPFVSFVVEKFSGAQRYTYYRSLALLILAAFLPLSTQSQQLPELVIHRSDDRFGYIRWIVSDRNGPMNETIPTACLRVYTENPNEYSNLPAVMGTYTQNGDTLLFQPRFPFLAGRTYWIWYIESKAPLASGSVMPFEVPQHRSLVLPEVTAIYPSTNLWPANQLKFYIHFNQAMRAGYLQEMVRIYDAEGKEVTAPFLDMAQELWDAEQQRLTVWFDPGRIKSLLIPNQQSGPPLSTGQTYYLVISKAWPAANGLSLSEDVTRIFRTTAQDDRQPDPSTWGINVPESGTTAPLVIEFPESMDRATLRSSIVLLTADEQLVDGHIEIGAAEQTWRWLPGQKWSTASYRLRISTDLEDLAGNNLNRLFDQPVRNDEPQDSQPMPTYIDLIIQIE